jgi:hypothetical protein
VTWINARRIEAWAGEVRVNVIRVIALVLLYGRHLIEYWTSPPDAPVRGAYHAQVTWACLSWAATAAALHVLLVRRRVPDWLKYFTVSFDAAMITLICCLARDGRTPLVMLYFLLIATAPLRMSLRVVYAATVSAMGGYLIQVANYAWIVIGYQKYYATPELRIPRSHEVFVVLCLVVAGLLAGQSVRQARRLSDGYPVTVTAEETQET